MRQAFEGRLENLFFAVLIFFAGCLLIYEGSQLWRAELVPNVGWEPMQNSISYRIIHIILGLAFIALSVLFPRAQAETERAS